MSYTLLKISALYPDYRSRFFKGNLSEGGSYDSIYTRLVSDSFAEADFFSRNLRHIGVDAHEVFMDACPLQKAWAAENNIKYLSNVYVLKHQIRSIRPDVIFIDNIGAIGGALLKEIRQINSGLRLVIGRCGLMTKDIVERAKHYDLILSATPGYNDELNRLGHVSHLMYHAFESTIAERLSSVSCQTDLIFSGSLGFEKDKHADRLSMLNRVCDLGLNLNITARIGKKDKMLMSLAEISSFLLGKPSSASRLSEVLPFDQMHAYSKLLPMINGPVYGMAMYNCMASSKICLNNHISLSGDYAGNMRLFEATGVGSCLLTDYKKNMSDLFELDYEVVTYKSQEELCDRAKWLIENESERKNIAAAGQKRTLKSHSYQDRAIALDNIIYNYL